MELTLEEFKKIVRLEEAILILLGFLLGFFVGKL